MDKDDENRILTQEEIEEALKDIEVTKRPAAERTRKIRLYDFKRDVIDKSATRALYVGLETFCRALTKYLQNDLELPAKTHLATVDEISRPEFDHMCPTPTFSLSCKWLGGLICLHMNPKTFFTGFLGRTQQGDQKITRNFSAFEKNVFMEYVANPCLERLRSAFEKKGGGGLSEMTDVQFEECSCFLPYGESVNEMGVLATVELSFGAGKNDSDELYLLEIFLNEQILESMIEKKIICKGDKVKVVWLEKPMGNVVAELGRCRIKDNLVLEKNLVLELNALAGEPLAVFVDGKKRWTGEAVVIDDSKGVRLCDSCSKNEGDFYNARVVFGWAAASKKETSAYGDGSIIPFEQGVYESVLLYKDGELVAKGEAVVLNESWGIKIKELVS